MTSRSAFQYTMTGILDPAQIRKDALIIEQMTEKVINALATAMPDSVNDARQKVQEAKDRNQAREKLQVPLEIIIVTEYQSVESELGEARIYLPIPFAQAESPQPQWKTLADHVAESLVFTHHISPGCVVDTIPKAEDKWSCIHILGSRATYNHLVSRLREYTDSSSTLVVIDAPTTQEAKPERKDTATPTLSSCTAKLTDETAKRGYIPFGNRSTYPTNPPRILLQYRGLCAESKSPAAGAQRLEARIIARKIHEEYGACTVIITNTETTSAEGLPIYTITPQSTTISQDTTPQAVSTTQEGTGHSKAEAQE